MRNYVTLLAAVTIFCAAAFSLTLADSFPILTGPYLGQEPPGMTPVKFAPGIISTSDHEFYGTFTPDAREFYFTRRPPIRDGSLNRIWFTRRGDKGWTEPTLAPTSYGGVETEPHVTPDGRQLWFGSRRPLDADDQSNKTRWWVTERTPDGWGEPVFPGPPFDDCMAVCFTNSGNVYQSDHLWSWTVDGKFLPWQSLGPPLTGIRVAMHPFVDPDEEYLLFDSEYEQGPNFNGLFISLRQSDTTWGDPIPLGTAFDIGARCGFPLVTPDKKYLFFVSEGDFYWVDAVIIEELKPEEVK